jgi:hypothetical protein
MSLNHGGLPWEFEFQLPWHAISISKFWWVVFKMKTRELLIADIYTFLQECLKRLPCSRTELSSLWRTFQAFENFRCILCFTWKLRNSISHPLSSIDCTGIDLGFQISPQKSRGEQTGQDTGALRPRPIQRLRTFSDSHWHTSRLWCGVAPSCWNDVQWRLLKDTPCNSGFEENG